jgi:hypothetical protein
VRPPRRAIELGVAACTVGRLSSEQLADFRAAVEATRPSEPFDIDSLLSKYGEFHEYYVRHMEAVGGEV